MNAEDLNECPQHDWRLEKTELREPEDGAPGAWTGYRCARCDSELWVPPGGEHPAGPQVDVLDDDSCEPAGSPNDVETSEQS